MKQIMTIAVIGIFLAVAILPGCTSTTTKEDPKPVENIEFVWESGEEKIPTTLVISRKSWRIKPSFRNDGNQSNYYVTIERDNLPLDRKKVITETDVLSEFDFEIEFLDGSRWEYDPDKSTSCKKDDGVITIIFLE